MSFLLMLIMGRLSLFHSHPNLELPLQFILASLHYRWNWHCLFWFTAFIYLYSWFFRPMVEDEFNYNCHFSLFCWRLSNYGLCLKFSLVCSYRKSLESLIVLFDNWYGLHTFTSNSEFFSNFRFSRNLQHFLNPWE